MSSVLTFSIYGTELEICKFFFPYFTMNKYKEMMIEWF